MSGRHRSRGLRISAPLNTRAPASRTTLASRSILRALDLLLQSPCSIRNPVARTAIPAAGESGARCYGRLSTILAEYRGLRCTVSSFDAQYATRCRISVPGAESSSPIVLIGAAEIEKHLGCDNLRPTVRQESMSRVRRELGGRKARVPAPACWTESFSRDPLRRRPDPGVHAVDTRRRQAATVLTSRRFSSSSLPHAYSSLEISS